MDAEILQCSHIGDTDERIPLREPIVRITAELWSDEIELCLQCANAVVREFESITGVYKDSSLEKDLTDDQESKGKQRAWLTWALDTSGLTSLKAVSLCRSHARHARILTANKVTTIKAWTEETITNHLYG